MVEANQAATVALSGVPVKDILVVLLTQSKLKQAPLILQQLLYIIQWKLTTKVASL